MSSPERGIWLEDATHREDLATFVERAVRLDDAAVIRLRERSGVWWWHGSQPVSTCWRAGWWRAGCDRPT